MPWLTGNAPIGDKFLCRRVLIPIDDRLAFVTAVSGALLDLTQAFNWQLFGELTPEEAAEYMRVMYDDFVAQECSGGSCPRIWRINTQTGQYEFSDDGGETWDTGETFVPPTPQRTVGESDPRCLAAWNAENVLAQLYEQSLDAWNTDASIVYGQVAFATTLGLAISSLFGASAAIVGAAWAVFAGAWELMQYLTADYYDDDIKAYLRCLLYDNITMTDNVPHVDYDAVQAALISRAVTDPLLRGNANLVFVQLNYFIKIIGQAGLDHAAATTAIEIADCDDCEDETWVYDITPERMGNILWFTPNTATNCAGNPNGSAGQAYAGTIVTVNGVQKFHGSWGGVTTAPNNLRMAGHFFIPNTATLTGVFVHGIVEEAGNTLDTVGKVTKVNTSCNYQTSTFGSPVGITGSWQGHIDLTINWADFGNHVYRFDAIRLQGTGKNPFL